MFSTSDLKLLLPPLETVNVVFADTRGPFSTAIKAATWGWCSHTALMLDEDTVIEATLMKGVHKSPLSELLARSNAWAIVAFPVYSAEIVKEAAVSQEGKKYDLQGVFGVSLHRDWQDTSDWWCSEHTAWSLEHGGPKLFRDYYKHRVTPPDLWKFPYPVLASHGLRYTP